MKLHIENLNKVYEFYFKLIKLVNFNIHMLIGLNNLLEMNSSLISKNIQTELKGALKKSHNYYVVQIKNKEVIPKPFKRLVYANGMNKNEPSNIIRIDINGFKSFVYGVQYVKPDSNGFYLIIHKNDIPNLIKLYKKTIKNYNWNHESFLNELENDTNDLIYLIEDEFNIKSSIEYDKIFKMKEEDRKNFFIMLKQCGINKRERQLLKEINRRKGGKPYSIVLEELEDKLNDLYSILYPLYCMNIEYENIRELTEEMKEAENTATRNYLKEIRRTHMKHYMEYYGEVKRFNNEYNEELETEEEGKKLAIEIENKITRLTEEDNSWNLFKTTIDDYY